MLLKEARQKLEQYFYNDFQITYPREYEYMYGFTKFNGEDCLIFFVGWNGKDLHPKGTCQVMVRVKDGIQEPELLYHWEQAVESLQSALEIEGCLK